MKRYFKVKYGYSISDQVSIEEKDLQKAILAQVKGIPVQIGLSYVNGRNIISITPHWHKHTGWYDWYEPNTGDDFAQIKRDCPDYEGVIEAHKNKVFDLMKTGNERLISEGNVEVTEEEIKALKAPRHKELTSGVKSIQEILAT